VAFLQQERDPPEIETMMDFMDMVMAPRLAFHTY
jgi:hypothetical protein